MDKPDIQALKKEIEKLYDDFMAPLPSGNSPQEVAQLRTQASHATSSMLVLSIYRRALEEYIRKREGEITLAHTQTGNIPTPKEQSLRAIIDTELATEKSYFHQLESLVDIAKTRTLLIMSLLKSLGEERYV